MYNRLHTIPVCDGQTERRTDKHLATAYPRYAYATHGKNDLCCFVCVVCFYTTF